MENKTKYQRILIKIGTNVLTSNDGHLNLGVMQNIVQQIAELKRSGIEVVLVTSGAMGAGRSQITLRHSTNEVAVRQVLAAVGQVKLIATYNDLLKEYGIYSAQILATKEDFRDQLHAKNMKSCIESLLAEGLLPIVNENDVVAITELMFTDNDELASLIAQTLSVDALFILTNVDGIFTGNPALKSSKLIKDLNPMLDDISGFVTADKSEFGRGGMQNKAKMAYFAARLGITVHIANGLNANTITSILSGEHLGTRIQIVH